MTRLSCMYSLEGAQQGSSNEDPKLRFSWRNEKRDNKQCLLDTPRRVTVNNKRLLSKCKKSEKKCAYMYLQKPWHY